MFIGFGLERSADGSKDHWPNSGALVRVIH